MNLASLAVPLILRNHRYDEIEANKKRRPKPKLCRAIELVLKTYLALHGFTQDELQDKFGHELKELLDEADKLDLAISQSARCEIKLLDEAHRKHWARYPKEDATPVFVIKHFEPSVEELFDAVRLKVRGPSLP